MAAPNRIECPLCQASIKAPLLAPGASCTCPKCGGAFRLAGGEEEPAEKPQASAVAVANNSSAPPTRGSSRPSAPQEESYPELAAPEASEPEAEDVPVVCHLCGTRFYAARKRIGSQVSCPDCHTANLVKPSKAKPKKAVVRITGDEYEFQDEPLPPRPPTTLMMPPTAEDLPPAPPVQHPPGEITKDLAAVMLTKAAAELDERGDTPHGNEDLQPFFHGTLTIFQQPPALVLCVMCGIGLALLTYDYRFVREGMSAALSLDQIFVLAGIAAGMAGLPLVLGPLAAAFQAIVQDTANGQKEVQSWPTLSFYDWLGDAMLTFAAVAAGGVPGALVMWALWTMSLPGLIIPGVGIASLWILFPIVFLSMSEANSLLAVATPAILKSFQRSGERWFLFYFATVLLAFGAFLCVAIMLEGTAWMVPPATIALVAGSFMYGRWLGKLASLIARDEVAAEEKAARTQKFLKQVSSHEPQMAPRP